MILMIFKQTAFNKLKQYTQKLVKLNKAERWSSASLYPHTEESHIHFKQCDEEFPNELIITSSI